MKKISYFLILFTLCLFSDTSTNIESFLFYKSTDKTLTIEDIKNKEHLFQPLTTSTQLDEKNVDYWIKIKFNRNLKSGKYLIKYQGFYFDKASLSAKQNLNKYRSDRVMVYEFYFNATQDSREQYLRVLNSISKSNPKITLYSYNNYYHNTLLKPDTESYFLVFGIIIGLLIMVIIYNITIYFLVKEASFLYYGFLQFFLIFIMMFDLGILSIQVTLFHLVSLLGSIFATLFMRSFLNTSTYLPFLDKVLKFYLLLIFLDLLHLAFTRYSLVSHFDLYPIFGFIYFLVGLLRLKQGFIPAKFFLIGWSFLVVSIFITGYIGTPFGFNTFLIGPPLEAIFLAIALVYKLKMLLDEKKEQQDLLVHQSKLASMGEMIGNIAHQWKQPLTYLSYNFMNLREVSSRNLLDDNYLKKKLDKAELQLAFMSQTIDNFKDFYLPNKTKESFSIEEASLETVEIISYELENKKIEVEVKVVNDFTLNSYKNL